MRNLHGVKFGSHHPFGRKPVQYPVMTTYSGVIFCRIAVNFTFIRESYDPRDLAFPSKPEADEREIPTFIMLRRLLLVAWIGSHSATDLAKEMGGPYTEGTVALAESYLSRFG